MGFKVHVKVLQVFVKMFTLKHLVVLFFLQNTVFSQYDEEDSCETTELEFGDEAMDYNGIVI